MRCPVNNKYWYELNGDRKGPVSCEELQNLFALGQIKSSTLVWSNHKSSEWIRYDQSDLFQGPPPLPSYENTGKSLDNSRWNNKEASDSWNNISNSRSNTDLEDYSDMPGWGIVIRRYADWILNDRQRFAIAFILLWVVIDAINYYGYFGYMSVPNDGIAAYIRWISEGNKPTILGFVLDGLMSDFICLTVMTTITGCLAVPVIAIASALSKSRTS